MRRVSFSDEVINLQLTSAGTHQYTTTSLSRGASREVTLSRLGNNNNVDEENPEAACVDDLYSKPVRQTDAAVVTAAAVVAVDDRDDNQKAGHEGPASSSSSNLRGLFSRGISKLFK